MTLSCILTPAVMYNDNWDELWLVLSAGEQERPSQKGVLRNVKRRVTNLSRMSISLFMVRIFHPIPHVTLVDTLHFALNLTSEITWRGFQLNF